MSGSRYVVNSANSEAFGYRYLDIIAKIFLLLLKLLAEFILNS